GAKASEGFAKQPAAAANIKNADALERADRAWVAAKVSDQIVSNIGQAHRVKLVQWLELARWVPPLFRHGREFCDFIVVDGGVGHISHSIASPMQHTGYWG